MNTRHAESEVYMSSALYTQRLSEVER